jgi:hypothetical protein
VTIDMRSNPLLVPVNIEALVVGQETTQWVETSPDFQGIPANRFLGQQLQNLPCSSTTSDLLKPGIHLHWALPDALSHGETGGEGEPSKFPAIPNRWLVVRVWADDRDEPVRMNLKAWVIESDTITDDNKGTPWPTLDKNSPVCVRVGNVFELTEWPGERGQAKVPLTAIGYGDPAFAASYPACKGMFGFHDSALDELDGMRLAYFVAGWYSDSGQDPLHRPAGVEAFDHLAGILERTRWVYPGFDALAEKVGKVRELARKTGEAEDMLNRVKDARTTAMRADSAHSLELGTAENELPKRIAELEAERAALAEDISGPLTALPGGILCHGAVTGIGWANKDTTYDNGVPVGKPFSLAVGNTAVEALAALFTDTLGGGLAELLGAFQYDLLAELEQPDGDIALQRKLHERTFSPIVSGVRWDLVLAGTQPLQEPSATGSPPIPGDIRDLLERLNNRQKEINRLVREKNWAQSQLYATWYKNALNAEAKTYDVAAIEQELTKLKAEIESLSGRIGEQVDPDTKAPRGSEWAELRAKIETLLPGYELTMLDEAPFWRPNDPMLLLSGPAFKRSLRHGDDGRFRQDGRLLCRMLGQQVSAIKITIPNAVNNDVEFGAAEVDGWYAPFAAPNTVSLPEGINELFREFLLLTMDRKRAKAAVSVVFEKNGQGFSKKNQGQVKSVVGQLLAYLEDLWRKGGGDNESARQSYDQTDFDLVGTFPSPVIINQWQGNPWLPLFLQWQATWSSTYTDAPSALNGWKMNEPGTGLEQESVQKSAKESTLCGSTLLTSGAVTHLSERLRQYNLSHNNPELEKLRTVIASLNLLGQSLGGFTDQLLMRRGMLELQPMDATEDGLQISDIYPMVHDTDWLSPITEGDFFPVRTGYLQFEKLWIVDAFGRVLSLEDFGALDSPHLAPMMRAPDNDRILLEPRLAQPARLFTEWLPSESGQDDGAVCGWIVPNFLDDGLMIYAADGTPLGALQSVLRKSWAEGFGGVQPDKESFHWFDMPGSDAFLFGLPSSPTLDPLGGEANPHLRKFVNALLGLKGGQGARWLENINFAMSTGRDKQNPKLSMLIGRPLALVRASLGLEVAGRPAVTQIWEKLSKDNTGGIEQLKIPVRLGERRQTNGVWRGSDGLAGFFLDNDYNHFYPAFGLGDPEQNDGYTICRKEPELSLQQALELTLLMEPSQGVCATTAILPRTFFHLPSGAASDVLENKEVIFYTGPLLTTAREIRMPQPSDIYGQWSWTHHPEVKVWLEESINDTQKEQGRFFEEPFRIAEGWLKLVTAPLSIRAFGVQGKEAVGDVQGESVPSRFELPADARIILFWEVDGADSIELQQDGVTILKSQRFPLPSRYLLKIGKESTSFTLIAAGRAKQRLKNERTTLAKTIEIKTIAIQH